MKCFVEITIEIQAQMDVPRTTFYSTLWYPVNRHLLSHLASGNTGRCPIFYFVTASLGIGVFHLLESGLGSLMSSTGFFSVVGFKRWYKPMQKNHIINSIKFWDTFIFLLTYKIFCILKSWCRW